MTTSPDLIEAVARAILAERYQLENGRLNTNISWETIDENTRVRYLDQARAALSVIENAGFVLMPKEPTEEMLTDAALRHPDGDMYDVFPLIISMYAALLSARPKVTHD